jgi:site-specific DNA recombinase
MKLTVPKPLRCAIYTRKSTEHNLDLAFNSLDAQREACEAYIKSQAHEGWRLLPEHYDDGGLSGASLERPALQLILAQVKQGSVDVIVVYKVDRLTRSLADFAKLVEAFDANEVSFVSVTQSFNTTSSMGRLTLNVLLSFAQFEREVIGERVRDKIAASKRKGIWVGGPVPLGYKSVAKKLVVVEEEAEQVRTIFRRYLALGSIGLLIVDLHQRGVRPRARIGRNDSAINPTHFMVGPLAHLLKNRFYIGEVAYRGEVHPGEHPPIIDRDLFQAVQARLRGKAVIRRVTRSQSPAFLMGVLYDDRGHRMSPSHANKKGVRYRYYVSQALLQNRKDEAGSIVRIAAAEIEGLVVAAVRHRVGDVGMQTIPGRAPPSKEISDRDLVALHVERIVILSRHIDITLRAGSSDARQALSNPSDTGEQVSSHQGAPTPMVLQLPWTPTSASARKGIAWKSSAKSNLDPAAIEALLTAIAKARAWMSDLVGGRAASFEEIAQRENKVERHIRYLAPLAFVSPRIVEAIANGNAPADLTVSTLARTLPHRWTEQERQLGRSMERRNPRRSGAFACLNSMRSSGRKIGMGGRAIRVHSMARMAASSLALSAGAESVIPGMGTAGMSLRRGMPVLEE